MKNKGKIIFILLISGILFGISTSNADLSVFSSEVSEVVLVAEDFSETADAAEQQQVTAAPKDTGRVETRFPVAKTVIENFDDVTQQTPIDLRNPDNLNSEFEYDPNSDTYLIRTKVGDSEVITPFSMTRDQYMQFSLDQSLQQYFRTRNAEEFANQGKEKTFSPFDMKFNLGPAEKLFGPGGVQLSINGTVDVKAALTHTYAGDPTRSEISRSRYAFDFDEQIQANVRAKVGDKVNFDLNYNTQTTFDFDSKKLKLAYQGKEDEVLKLLEAGNVSMTTSNSLINGGAALFGIRAEMQFGKLKVGSIFSQQESQSKTISSKKGVQTTPFEITADAYDENQHFFLAHYFRDNYDEAMLTLPFIKSGISIDRIEVWVTNTRSNFDQARNFVAFSDLAESDAAHINNDSFAIPDSIVGKGIPFNNANELYRKIVDEFPDARNSGLVNQELSRAGLQLGTDYEKIGSARKLNESEYTLNRQLGYISLRTKLYSDEVLAVAFEFTYRGKTYQVGELSKDNPDNPDQSMYLKLLKGTSMTPSMPFWDLMMKNVYSLNTYSLQQDKFRFDVLFQNDTTGTYLNYISEGAIANQVLLRAMNLDRLDIKNNPYPDGFFDYVEEFTVSSQTGRIIFPVVEPFGSNLRRKIIGKATGTELDALNKIAEKYVFDELYNSTVTDARQTEKNKFIMRGEYRGAGSSGGDIDLGTYNVARGSVRVTSNGQILTEGSDYTVDYVGGKVTLAQHIADSGAPVSVSLENQAMYGMQRKTLMGLNLEYQFNPDFNIGATVMNLREMPLTLKVNMGEESVNNTIYGFNTNWKKESQWLTNMLDKLPFLDLTAPSQINFSAEFAQLIPGHYKSKLGGNFSYIDDFERTKIVYDLRSPQGWFLAGTPYDDGTNGRPQQELKFREKAGPKYMNSLEYGNDRALLAWYTIDPMFTRRRNSLTPAHIRNDLEQLSNHYVREVTEMELFPNKDLAYNEPAMLTVLNLAYYPKERGPYNLDTKYNRDGTLQNPKDRWGGIMRRIERSQTDFEAANVEYIEFWLMDPFIYEPGSNGGNLFINLGEISEDILKDGKKFFENGLPVGKNEEENERAVDRTIWGKVPNRQSTVYAFDSNPENRRKQDVGLNGLSTEEEFRFEYLDEKTNTIIKPYENFTNALKSSGIDPQVLAKWEQDPFSLSPLKDPSGDNFQHFRGSELDAERVPILGRYKRFNGTEGNSRASEDSQESFSTSSQIAPDIEDINQDNTLNETERYYEYTVELNPNSLEVGENYIVDKRTARVTLRNGEKDVPVNWYQFKIPVRDGKAINNIKDFKTIRFMRMYMTNFEDSVILRFGELQLVRGGWRAFTQDLSTQGTQPVQTGTIDVAVVNIEENSTRTPVNYVIPPGVSRTIDPGQSQLRQENEQAMSIRIKDLARGDARAVFQTAGLDTRQYRKLQMFVHAEALIDDNTDLQSNELSIFLRLGSDFRNNYYEYEIPLRLTPPGTYSNFIESDRLAVWPEENMFDFPFEVLTNLKLNRNREKRKAGSTVTFFTPYTETDPNKPNNQMTIVGNPTLSDVKTIMIGIRNNGRTVKSGEVWVNELRVTDFNEDGGWAGNANLNIALSDLGTVNFAGRMETAGFGSLDQGIMERSLDDFYQYNVSANVELGKLFAEKAKVSMPMFYTYSEQVTSSKYNPLDQDVLLKEALDAAGSKSERDSIKNFAQDVITTRSIAFNNVKVGIKSENPMPWDPDNFNFSYSFAENNKHDPSIEYERNTDTRVGFGYGYSPYVKPFAPFQNMNSKSGSTKLLREFSLNYLPNSFTFNSEILRSYYELQLRDLNSMGAENVIPPSFREDFFWNRSMSLQWNLTKNLNMSIQTGTQARIETGHLQANKDVNRDEYKQWKDSVWNSLMDLGTPLAYKQTFNATYTIPFRSIPILDFMNGSLGYTANYNWDRGAQIQAFDPEDNFEMGNIITNERTFSINNVNLNFLNLYNKSAFLKKTNEKFKMKRPTATAQSRNNTNTNNANKPRIYPVRPERKKFEGEVQLNTDSVTVVSHNLNNKRVRVTARGANGRLYNIKFKVVDPNTIKITTKDSVKLNLAIAQLRPPEETMWYKVAQVTARGAMLVRSVGFTYNQRSGLMLPNFRPNVGDAFGQGRFGSGYAPGLDFAFGFTDESYIQKAFDRKWLIMDDENVASAIFNTTETFTFKATLEPIVGMKIDLDARRSTTNRQETLLVPYTEGNATTQTVQFESLPRRLGGMFEMTTVAIGSAFEGSSVNNNFQSDAFNKFLGNRHIIKNRLDAVYAGLESKLPGGAVNPVSLNSVDVLIPSFLAAYTGKNPNKIALTAFPSLKSILPNWKISYEGLMQLNFINQHFKNFVLSHQYNCRYVVGTYASFLSWTELEDGYGYIRDVLTNNHTLSSPYDISAATITEAFNPLIGLNATFKNNMSLKLELRNTRNLNLNLSSFQIVESNSDDYVIGIGYKLTEFNKVLKIKGSGGANFSNDLTISADFSYRKMISMIRKIQDAFTQGTNGDAQTTIKISADYNLSRKLTVQAFFDRAVSKPLVSSTAYPFSKSSAGINLKLMLSR